MIVRDSRFAQFADDAAGDSIPWTELIGLGKGIVDVFKPPPVYNNTYVQAPEKSGLSPLMIAGGAGLLLLTVVLATRR